MRHVKEMVLLEHFLVSLDIHSIDTIFIVISKNDKYAYKQKSEYKTKYIYIYGEIYFNHVNDGNI